MWLSVFKQMICGDAINYMAPRRPAGTICKHSKANPETAWLATPTTYLYIIYIEDTNCGLGKDTNDRFALLSKNVFGEQERANWGRAKYQKVPDFSWY